MKKKVKNNDTSDTAREQYRKWKYEKMEDDLKVLKTSSIDRYSKLFFSSLTHPSRARRG
jgi:hypothetical protein